MLTTAGAARSTSGDRVSRLSGTESTGTGAGRPVARSASAELCPASHQAAAPPAAPASRKSRMKMEKSAPAPLPRELSVRRSSAILLRLCVRSGRLAGLEAAA